MKHLPRHLPLLSIFTLAFLIRLIYNVTIAKNYKPVFDAALYDFLASNLLEQGCYCIKDHFSTISRAPFWPFIMAGIYFFTGKEEFYARLFYCLLGSGTCVMVYSIARKIF